MKKSDDYIRLEAAEKICEEVKENVFTDGDNISMPGFASKWKGYPDKSQAINFFLLMRRTELEKDALFFGKLYGSLETICNKLKKQGVPEAENFLKTIEILKDVSKDNLNQVMPMGYVVNGKKLSPNDVIENLLYGEILHSDIGKMKKRKENGESEDVAFFYALSKYVGYYTQLQNVVRVFDGLKPYIDKAEQKRTTALQRT